MSSLRSNVSQMREDINAYLTHKMEEDKAVESGKSNKKRSKQEEREEEMYGEENDDGE